MDKVQKAVVASLVATSAVAWISSIQQPDMMTAMATYNPLVVSLFTASWTAGMAAMMFPAITPMVLLYNTFVTSKQNKDNRSSSITLQEEAKPKSSSIRSFRVILFIGCYLLVWALTGIALLLGWSVVMNNTIMATGNSSILPLIYGAVLIIAGVYQFTPLKKICIGYCESPMSFFMRRWRDGTTGAVKMGLWHGLYCLGCCWAYFLLMVALGWMNLLWMGLFAGIIFGEKIWSKGIWVARAAGIGLSIVGVLVIAGMLPSLVTSASSMSSVGDGTDMGSMNMETDNTMSEDNSDMPAMGEGSKEGAMRNALDDSSPTTSMESSDEMTSPDGKNMGDDQGMEGSMESDEGESSMSDMEMK
jgi:predicted metal-binding membrane protein